MRIILLGLLAYAINPSQGLISTNPKDINFLLYAGDPNSSQRIDPDAPETVRAATFINGPTKFLIHGYNQDGSTEFPQDVKDAYLETTPINAIIVDWGRLASNNLSPLIGLPIAISNVKKVSNKTATLLGQLQAESKIGSPSDVHILGFSLGAQVAGLASAQFTKENGGGKIARITGLDPGGGTYDNADPDERLDPTDAEFVDVVHTASGLIGTKKDLGHIDFWMNNGGKAPQPGCPFIDLLPLPSWCSHIKAYQYYAESIRSNEVIEACECESRDWRQCSKNCQNPVPFGDPTPPGSSGVYHVEIK